MESTFDLLPGVWELNSHEEKFTITLKADKTYHSEYIIKGDGSITKTRGVFEMIDLGTYDVLRLLILYNPTDKIKTIYEVRELAGDLLKLSLDEKEQIITLKKILTAVSAIS